MHLRDHRLRHLVDQSPSSPCRRRTAAGRRRGRGRPSRRGRGRRRRPGPAPAMTIARTSFSRRRRAQRLRHLAHHLEAERVPLLRPVERDPRSRRRELEQNGLLGCNLHGGSLAVVFQRVTAFTTRPELRGTFGMVASTHWLASAAGMAVLERGGNAFDAAVAAGFTLQVVEPHLNGPGGDLPAVFWSAERGEPLVLCAQGVVAGRGDDRAFPRARARARPGHGVFAACVPGAFGGWLLLLREFGTWRLEDVLEFAIGYAEDGYPVVPGITATIERVESLLREWPASAALYLPAPRPGELFRNPQLAATYPHLPRVARWLARGARSSAPASSSTAASSRTRSTASAPRTAASSPATTWPRGARRSRSRHLRLPRLHGVQERRRGARGRSSCSSWRSSTASTSRTRARRELRPHSHRVREAGVRRPRRAVRRRGCPARPAALARVQRRAPEAGRRRRVVRAAARPRPDAAGSSRRRRHSAPVSRRAGATPSIWTSPTASATSSRRRRAAAGSTARRPSRRSAGRSGRARRCSGWRKGCRPRSRRASGRGRRWRRPRAA